MKKIQILFIIAHVTPLKALQENIFALFFKIW